MLFLRGNGQYLVPLVGWTQGMFRIAQNDDGTQAVLDHDGNQVFGLTARTCAKRSAFAPLSTIVEAPAEAAISIRAGWLQCRHRHFAHCRQRCGAAPKDDRRADEHLRRSSIWYRRSCASRRRLRRGQCCGAHEYRNLAGARRHPIPWPASHLKARQRLSSGNRNSDDTSTHQSAPSLRAMIRFSAMKKITPDDTPGALRRIRHALRLRGAGERPQLPNLRWQPHPLEQ